MKKTAEEILDSQSHGYDSGQYKSAIKAMEEYADQFKPKWIPVSDDFIGIPVHENILGICDEVVSWCYTDYMNNEDVVGVNGAFPIPFSDAKFTHWMLLPEKPEL